MVEACEVGCRKQDDQLEGRVRQEVSELHEQGRGRKEAGVRNTVGADQPVLSPMDGQGTEKVDGRKGGVELSQGDSRRKVQVVKSHLLSRGDR